MENQQDNAAIEAFKEVLQLDPGYLGAEANIGLALSNLDKHDQALEYFRNAYEKFPNNATILVSFGNSLIRNNKPHLAIELVGSYLKAHPYNVTACSFMAHALNEIDDEHLVAELHDFDSFLFKTNAAYSSAIKNADAFNKQCAKYVLKHPSLVNATTSVTTIKGQQTSELGTDPGSPIRELKKFIEEAFTEYAQLNLDGSRFPWAGCSFSDFSLNIWGCALDRGGHQDPHIHPNAWVSGVFYPQLPDIIGQNPHDNAGYIEFGRTEKRYFQSNEPRTRLIKPELGMLILFPSYFSHATIPFDSNQKRISIAFDLCPIG